MIKIHVLRKPDRKVIGFQTEGHSGFDVSGRDIICAGISALEITLVNATEELTDAKFSCREDDRNGLFSFRLLSEDNRNAGLLLESCLIGFRSIEEEYGGRFLKITDEEV